MTRAWKERPNTPPSMDNPRNNSAAAPGYETRDANVRSVFNFLVILGAALVASALLCWGLFRHFSKQQTDASVSSPFGDTRPLPLGPELQVNPRQDWLKYHDQQEQSLETYEWQNRGAGIVRVPIERAMELLVHKGLPVQNPGSQAAESAPAKISPALAGKSAPQAGKKP